MPVIDNDEVDAAEASKALSDHAAYVLTRDNLGGNSEFTEMMQAIGQDFPEIKAHMLQELLDFMVDKGWLASGKRKAFSPGYEAISKFKEICSDTWNEQPHLKTYARFRVLNQPWLDDIYGGLTPTEFARHLGISKQAVVKECKETRKRLRLLGLKLEVRSDERDEEACDNMKQARTNQLVTS